MYFKQIRRKNPIIDHALFSIWIRELDERLRFRLRDRGSLSQHQNRRHFKKYSKVINCCLLITHDISSAHQHL